MTKLNSETFEQFWEEVETFAKKAGVPTTYVESEFIIDGEFIPVYPKELQPTTERSE